MMEIVHGKNGIISEVLWMGRPLSELSHKELLDVLAWCWGEIQHLRQDRDRWQRAGDSIKYMMAK